jgi:hypothetical protein
MSSDAEVVEALARGRAKDVLLAVEAYCGNTDCPAREVRIDVKDHDETLLGLVRANGLRCPICGSLTKLHGVRTSSEVAEADAQAARWSVNQQMYNRDHN